MFRGTQHVFTPLWNISIYCIQKDRLIITLYWDHTKIFYNSTLKGQSSNTEGNGSHETVLQRRHTNVPLTHLKMPNTISPQAIWIKAQWDTAEYNEGVKKERQVSYAGTTLIPALGRWRKAHMSLKQESKICSENYKNKRCRLRIQLSGRALI